jgi:hypothetical protein
VQLVRVEPEPWPQAAQLPEVAQSRHVVTGTPVQVAQGFSIAYTPVAASLAIVAGLVAAVAGAGMVTVAIATLAALALTWLAGYVVTVVVSAAGADLARVTLTYRLLRHEQKHRHEREGGQQ